MKILITGGSGFIGTNLMQYYLEKGYTLLNIDIAEPRNPEHKNHWQQVTILDLATLKKFIDQFAPDYLIHLAARTDLRENKDLNGYLANHQGTENIIKAIKGNKHLKKVIFASSMLVCKVGYIPRDYDDYAPSTIYGQSKVMMEKIIKNSRDLEIPWIIVRPTSIWGPWFGDPYIKLFEYIKKGRYYLITGKTCIKTCGYVRNTVWQIDKLLHLDDKNVNKKTFCLGDKPYYNMAEWAQEIAQEFNGGQLKTIPFYIFKILALMGDTLSKFGFKFPMTSFRFKNMTTNNMVPLDDLFTVTGSPPYTRRKGTQETLLYLLQKN